MKGFSVIIENQEYRIEPGLHPGFFSVSCGGKSSMLAKGIDGVWEYSLETSESLNVSAEQLGKEIEELISSDNAG